MTGGIGRQESVGCYSCGSETYSSLTKLPHLWQNLAGCGYETNMPSSLCLYGINGARFPIINRAIYFKNIAPEDARFLLDQNNL